MARKTDNNLYTIVFAIVMVMVIGTLLAFLASSLKPRITENMRFEKQQNILYAMGVHNNQGDNDIQFITTDVVGEVFDQYIINQYYIQDGEIIEDDQAYLIDLAREEALTRNPDYQKRLPFFVGEKDGETFYIVPVLGKGLWDAIWGFVALDKNFIVKGVFFDHAAETPGLGANIRTRFFMDAFEGEHIFDQEGYFAGITVAKGNNDPANVRKTDNRVDAIAGSTITGDGVTAMLRNYLRAYIPHIQQLIQ